MAIIIKNQLNQRLIINLPGGKNLDVLAKGTSQVSGDEFSSGHLQLLISKGDIIVLQIGNAGKSGITGKSTKEKKDVKKRKIK